MPVYGPAFEHSSAFADRDRDHAAEEEHHERPGVFLAGAIAINVAVVYWALCLTAAENSYAGYFAERCRDWSDLRVLIVAVSWLLLSVVFPDALEE